MTHGQITFAEIMSQPAVWDTSLKGFHEQFAQAADLFDPANYDQIILTGCGSTYYLSVIGAALLQNAMGIPARACSATELMLFPRLYFLPQRRTLLICVSRSGTTRETVEALRLFREFAAGKAVAVTCHSESPLAQQADFIFAVDHAREDSRVQTRSFSSMTLMLMALASGLSHDGAQLQALPGQLERLLHDQHDLIRSFGEDQSINQITFLGSGLLYGLACEAMLKMTEMSRVFSTAYHPLEFLHGPRYAINERSLVVGLVGGDSYAEDVAALEQLTQRKARIVTLVERELDPDIHRWSTCVQLNAALPTRASLIVYLPLLQLLGYYQGVSRGYDPDNLSYEPAR